MPSPDCYAFTWLGVEIQHAAFSLPLPLPTQCSPQWHRCPTVHLTWSRQLFSSWRPLQMTCPFLSQNEMLLAASRRAGYSCAQLQRSIGPSLPAVQRVVSFAQSLTDAHAAVARSVLPTGPCFSRAGRVHATAALLAHSNVSCLCKSGWSADTILAHWAISSAMHSAAQDAGVVPAPVPVALRWCSPGLMVLCA